MNVVQPANLGQYISMKTIYIYLRSTQYVIKHDIKKLFICCYCEFVHPENVVKSKDNQQQKSVWEDTQILTVLRPYTQWKMLRLNVQEELQQPIRAATSLPICKDLGLFQNLSQTPMICITKVRNLKVYFFLRTYNFYTCIWVIALYCIII